MSKKYLILEIENCKQCIYCGKFALTQYWEAFRYYCYHPMFKSIKVYSRRLSESIEDDDHDVASIDIPKWCPICPDEVVDTSRFTQLEL